MAPKSLLLLQLSLLLSLISTTVHTADATLQHPHPPSPAPAPHHPTPAPTPGPVKPPVHPPVKAPTKSPVPVHPPLKAPTKSPVPVHPPVKAPTKSPVPVHPPVKPPTKSPVPVHPPVKPPTASPPSPLPVRKQMAIRGVVFCKSCKNKGVNTLMDAKPLFKADVKLQCNNTKQRLVETTQTDKNGFFVFRPKKVSKMAFHKCKVFLVSSKNCSVLTNLHGGVSGAVLIPDPKPPVASSLYKYYNVGPFAFEPSHKC